MAKKFIRKPEAAVAGIRYVVMLWCWLLIGLPASTLAQPAVDFPAIIDNGRLSALAYRTESEIRRVLATARLTLQAYEVIEDIQLAYFIVRDEKARRQTIVLRGTSNAENAILDISANLVKDPHSGLMLHEGFAYAAWQVFLRIRDQLETAWRIDTTGHSLGGALALVLAKYLQLSDFQVGQVITFGQPKVTNIDGAKSFAGFPVIRVVTPLDMVPLLPPFDPVKMATGDIQIYWHAGIEVLLLKGNRYSILQGIQSMMRTTGFDRQDITGQALSHHSMDYYLQLLSDKNANAQAVPFESGFNLFRLFGGSSQ